MNMCSIRTLSFLFHHSASFNLDCFVLISTRYYPLFIDNRFIHGISRQLKISRRCIRQTIRKFDQLNTVATKPGGGRPKKITDREKRLIKLQQIRDDTLSLADLVQYARTKLNLSISSSTISRILREYNMVSFIAPRKPQITPKQRRRRVECCYAHLNWSVEDWSRVIFSDESNCEVLNRKNRIYIRRFRHDRTRFERSQKRVHHGGGIRLVFLFCNRVRFGRFLINSFFASRRFRVPTTILVYIAGLF